MERGFQLYGWVADCPRWKECENCKLLETAKLRNFEKQYEIIEKLPEVEIIEIENLHKILIIQEESKRQEKIEEYLKNFKKND